MGDGSNAIIIGSAATFYLFIFVMFGLIGMGLEASAPDVSGTNFITGIGFTIKALPWWANTMLFGSMALVTLYIGLRLARGGG
jgi:hypothetical protein